MNNDLFAIIINNLYHFSGSYGLAQYTEVKTVSHLWNNEIDCY